MLNTIRVLTCVTCVFSTSTFIPSGALADDDSARKQRAPDPVAVVNTPLPVQMVPNPSDAATPVAFRVGGSINETYSVPLGKRLTIEYVSGGCSPQTDPGAVVAGFPPVPPFPGFRATTAGVELSHSVALAFNPILYDPARGFFNVLTRNIARQRKFMQTPEQRSPLSIALRALSFSRAYSHSP